jgi:SH3-like domain-containing protein
MFKRILLTLFVVFLSLFLVPLVFAPPVFAQGSSDVGSVTNLPIPRFVSLRSDAVSVRAGPGKRYPVKWMYQRQGYPVQIVQEFDTWRKIQDADGDAGWVHQSLLSGNRYVLVGGQLPVALRRKPDDHARVVAQLEPGVVAKFNECKQNWCDVSVSGYDGWLLKNLLWGVYEHDESE